MKKKRVSPHFNLHELVDDLEKTLSLTPEQKFRVTAKIKRHVHDEKAGLLMRLFHYTDYSRCKSVKKKRRRKKAMESSLRFMHETIKGKLDTHNDWATFPDEQVVTWSVGSFTYPPKKPEVPQANEA